MEQVTTPNNSIHADEPDIKSLQDDARFWHGADERALLELNKTLITLSTGGIGVSVALLTKELYPDGWIEFLLLLAAWALFALAAVFILLSYAKQRRTANIRVQHAQLAAQGGLPADLIQLAEESANSTASRTKTGQWLFIAGVVTLIAFFSTKISEKVSCQRETISQELPLDTDSSTCSRISEQPQQTLQNSAAGSLNPDSSAVTK